MTLSRKIAGAFVAVMLIFLGVSLAVFFNTRAIVEHSHWVKHTHDVIENVMMLRLRVKEFESDVRGFVASGRADLRPRDAARSEADELFKRLRVLTADNPRQVKNFEELGPILTKRMSALEAAIMRRTESGLASGEPRTLPPVAIPALDDANRQVMLETSRLLDVIVEEERTLLKLRNAAASDAASSTYWIILGGTVGTAVLTSFAAWFLIRSVTLPVREALGHLSITSTEMLSATSQQASTAQEQVSAVSETVATVAQITHTADNSALRAGTLGSSVQKSMEISENGRQAVEDAIDAVGGVKRQIGVTTDNIVTLAGKAQAIGDIISTVTDIAEQTNMLALNAAIEASRAGEHGRGFAVVAAEVKALAGQSKRATAQVRDILGEIQKATNAAVFSTEEVTKSAASAERVAGQAGVTIKTLTETISEAARVGLQIVASAGQQAAGMKQINQAMRDLEGSARQNLSSTRQIEDAARNLNALGKTLQGVIGVER